MGALGGRSWKTPSMMAHRVGGQQRKDCTHQRVPGREENEHLYVLVTPLTLLRSDSYFLKVDYNLLCLISTFLKLGSSDCPLVLHSVDFLWSLLHKADGDQATHLTAACLAREPLPQRFHPLDWRTLRNRYDADCHNGGFR